MYNQLKNKIIRMKNFGFSIIMLGLIAVFGCQTGDSSDEGGLSGTINIDGSSIVDVSYIPIPNSEYPE